MPSIPTGSASCSENFMVDVLIRGPPRQTVFYTPDTIIVSADETITGQLTCAPNARNPRDLDITITYKAPHEEAPKTVNYKMCVLRFFPQSLPRPSGFERTLTNCQVVIDICCQHSVFSFIFCMTRHTPYIYWPPHDFADTSHPKFASTAYTHAGINVSEPCNPLYYAVDAPFARLLLWYSGIGRANLSLIFSGVTPIYCDCGACGAPCCHFTPVHHLYAKLGLWYLTNRENGRCPTNPLPTASPCNRLRQHRSL